MVHVFRNKSEFRLLRVHHRPSLLGIFDLAIMSFMDHHNIYIYMCHILIYTPDVMVYIDQNVLSIAYQAGTNWQLTYKYTTFVPLNHTDQKSSGLHHTTTGKDHRIKFVSFLLPVFTNSLSFPSISNISNKRVFPAPSFHVLSNRTTRRAAVMLSSCSPLLKC